ncbi:MAG TPA: DUF2278 family protein [Spirochaetota bacterium]|nr:DUF2278 family protein [Spirochaetota bacterium]
MNLCRTICTLMLLLLYFSACSLAPETAPLDPVERALAWDYGVWIGQVTSHCIEGQAGEGKWPHYMIKAHDGNVEFSCAINFYSRNETIPYKDVTFSTMDPDNGIFSLPNGWKTLKPKGTAPNPSSGSLDFIRHPGILKLINGHPWKTDPLIDSSKTNSPFMRNLLKDSVRIYVFGEKFHYNGNGVHDIHQNQGNPATSPEFGPLNGTWQDGGIIVEYPPIVTVKTFTVIIGGIERTIRIPVSTPQRRLFMTRFRVQSDFTDNNGHGINPNIYSFSRQVGYKDSPIHYGPYVTDQLEVESTSSIVRFYVKKGSPASPTNYDFISDSFLKCNGQAEYYICAHSQFKISGRRLEWDLTIRKK